MSGTVEGRTGSRSAIARLCRGLWAESEAGVYPLCDLYSTEAGQETESGAGERTTGGMKKQKEDARVDTPSDSTDSRTASWVAPSSLKACPFCGGEAAFATVRYSSVTMAEQEWEQDMFHYVSCVACGACNRGLVGHRNQFLAAVRWNSRPGEHRAAVAKAEGR